MLERGPPGPLHEHDADLDPSASLRQGSALRRGSCGVSRILLISDQRCLERERGKQRNGLPYNSSAYRVKNWANSSVVLSAAKDLMKVNEHGGGEA